MKYRIIVFFALLAFVVVSLGASVLADSKPAKKANASDLVALLPGSDGVFVFDSKRFFGEALPKILASNQPLLAKITSKIEQAKTRTGIDVREFDSVAAGISTRHVGNKQYDVDPVIVARGRMTSASLIGAAKIASNGKYREERVGERVMYIFDAPKIAADAQKVTTPSVTEKVLGDMSEIAVAALAEKTIAFGEVGRVRQTLEAKTRVNPELITMLEKNMTSVAAFAAKPPAGLKAFLPLENDELGKNIDSIQYLYGNAVVGPSDASVHVTARTSQNSQATSLYETLEGLQMLGKAFLGGSKSADKQVYSRMIENAKFAVKGNEVSFDLVVPQSDIDIVVGSFK